MGSVIPDRGSEPLSILQPASPMPATRSIPDLRLHRDVDLVLRSEINCTGITRIGMAQNSCAGIACEHALQSAFGNFGAIGNDHHASMLRKTDANAAAVMNGHP